LGRDLVGIPGTKAPTLEWQQLWCGDLDGAGDLGRAANYEGFTGHDRYWGSRDLKPVRIVFYAGATAGSAPIVRGAPQDPYVSNP
jgi:hypothetical protein